MQARRAKPFGISPADLASVHRLEALPYPASEAELTPEQLRAYVGQAEEVIQVGVGEGRDRLIDWGMGGNLQEGHSTQG